MQTFHVDPLAIEAAALERAGAVLRSGGVVVHPTDTCYGLAVDVRNQAALAALYRVKAMPLDKPVSILVRSLEEAQIYGEFSELALALAQEFWPGPLTLVLPRTEALPEFLNPGVPRVGIRVVAEPVSVALLEQMDGPLTTTSANRHGLPSPFVPSDVSVEADLFLEVGALADHKSPSTILAFGGGGDSLRGGVGEGRPSGEARVRGVEVLRKGDLYAEYQEFMERFGV